MPGGHGQGSIFLEESELGKAYDSAIIKKLWNFISPHKWLIIFSIALLPFAAGLQLIQPYLIKTAIDENISKGKIEGLDMIAVIFLCALIFQYLVTFLQQFLLQVSGQRIILDIRTKLFAHVLRLPLRFFDKNPVGRVVTRLTSDVEALNEMFTSGIAAFIGDGFMLAGIMVAMFLLDAKLALVTLIIIPFLAIIAGFFRIKGRKAYRGIRTKTALVNSYLEENLSGIEIVKLFRREKRNFGEFRKYNGELRSANISSVFYDSFLYASVELIGSVAVAIIIWYGGGQIIRETLTFGILVAFLEYVQKFFVPIRDLSAKYAIMQQAMAASERILNLFDEKEENILEEKEKPDSLKGKIEFKDISFSYGESEKNVVKNFSLSIQPGEKIAIVGATGAGKSTLLKFLMRFYEPSRGSVLIDGININDINRQWIRKNIGIVPQDIFLFSGNIESNLKLANSSITKEILSESIKKARADRVIDKLSAGLDEVVFERGNNFSSGEKQLLSFARVLTFNPAILILDEATSNIDAETEHLIQEGLKELLKGRTSIVVAHRLSTIKNVDRIAVMHHGELRELGTHEELLEKRGIYYRLYKYQGGNDIGKKQRLLL